jgi:small nuclear ribonucleoprotein (snRNP)-like protein
MKKTIMYVSIIATFSSCGDITAKLEEKQRILDGKLNSLDSTLNVEISKVMKLDTLITKEKAMLDSIINIEHKILGK